MRLAKSGACGEPSLKSSSHKAFPSIEDFDAHEKSDCHLPSLLFFEPPSLSPRIINQYAFFSVMPDPTFDTQRFLEAHPEYYCWKVVIRASLEKEIRERLLIMNVSERTIYPGARWNQPMAESLVPIATDFRPITVDRPNYSESTSGESPWPIWWRSRNGSKPAPSPHRRLVQGLWLLCSLRHRLTSKDSSREGHETVRRSCRVTGHAFCGLAADSP